MKSASSPRLKAYLPALVCLLVIVFLAATAPAWLMSSVIAFASKGKAQIETPEGSFWKGRAASLTIPLSNNSRQRFDSFSWDILFSRLLRGQLAAHIALMDNRVNANGITGVTVGGPFIDQLDASLPAELLSAFAPSLSMASPGGNVHISTGKFELQPLQIIDPATVQWKAASVGFSKVAPLGDYDLKLMPNGNNVKFDVKTVNGALLINGNGQYSFTSGGEFQGSAQAAAEFKDQLKPLLQLLGPLGTDGSVSIRMRLPASR